MSLEKICLDNNVQHKFFSLSHVEALLLFQPLCTSCFRGGDLEPTQKENRSVMFRSALFLHPPRSYLSARPVNSAEARETEQPSAPEREKN